MRAILISACTAVIVGIARFAPAQTVATLSYTAGQQNSTTFQYSFTLTNTGTTDIGTIRLAWLKGSDGNPPYDLLFSNPVAGAADGWTGFSTHDGLGGYAVEWYATGAGLAAGQSLSGFTITTTDTPAYLAGPSILGPTEPVLTSWVFVGSDQDGSDPLDPGMPLVATAVPEPAAVVLIHAAIFLSVYRRRFAN